jgi:Bacterial Ig-like domain (group 1)
MGATLRRVATGSTGSWRSIGLLAVLLLVGALIAACSNQSSSNGPGNPAGLTGNADNPTQMIVRVAIHRAQVEVGDRVGITVVVTNSNGRPLEGRHVQLSISNSQPGRLDQVDGFTDPDGKFTTFLFCSADGTPEITAFVEGAFGIGSCTCGAGTTGGTTTAGTPTPTTGGGAAVPALRP